MTNLLLEDLERFALSAGDSPSMLSEVLPTSSSQPKMPSSTQLPQISSNRSCPALADLERLLAEMEMATQTPRSRAASCSCDEIVDFVLANRECKNASHKTVPTPSWISANRSSFGSEGDLDNCPAAAAAFLLVQLTSAVAAAEDKAVVSPRPRPRTTSAPPPYHTPFFSRPRTESAPTPKSYLPSGRYDSATSTVLAHAIPEFLPDFMSGMPAQFQGAASFQNPMFDSQINVEHSSLYDTTPPARLQSNLSYFHKESPVQKVSKPRTSAQFTLIVNVPTTTTRQELVKAFSQIGTVELAKVVCGKESRHPKKEWTATAGYAFVRFASHDEAVLAQRAAAAGVVTIRGSVIRASWANMDSYARGSSTSLQKEHSSSDADRSEPENASNPSTAVPLISQMNTMESTVSNDESVSPSFFQNFDLQPDQRAKAADVFQQIMMASTQNFLASYPPSFPIAHSKPSAMSPRLVCGGPSFRAATTTNNVFASQGLRLGVALP